jgi:multidrug efflux pump subunit AcrA (membrane-fusion protein)
MNQVIRAIGGLLVLAVALPLHPSASAQPPKENQVEATGTLVPSDLHPVYAPFPGIVRALHCRAGEEVRKGQKLATLASPELEGEIARATAEVEVSKAQIELFKRALTEGRTTGEEKRRMGFELEVARVKAESGGKQLEELRRKYNGGDLLSPVDGTVISSNPEQLIGKKVEHEPVVVVARLDGDWHADVWFAERDVGRLLQFLGAAKEKRAAVELVVAAFPGKTFPGTLRRDELAREMTRREKDSVLHAHVRLDADSLKVLRILPVGANVRVTVSVPGAP